MMGMQTPSSSTTYNIKGRASAKKLFEIMKGAVAYKNTGKLGAEMLDCLNVCRVSYEMSA